MKRATYAAAAAITLLLAGEARAMSGNQLHQACQGGADIGLCLGYIIGVADLARTLGMESARALGIEPYCLPDGVTNGQIQDVATRYLLNHPEHRHTVAAALVWMALREGFPC